MKRLGCLIALALTLAACGSATTPTAAPGSARATSTSTTLKAVDCPGASISVHGTTGERLDASWLPPGFKRTSGSETDLGPQGGPQYFILGGSDPPFVLLSRFHSSVPIADILGANAGKTQQIQIHGHSGAITDDGFGRPPTTAISWTYAPGIELKVQAHNVSHADAIRVADGVQYAPGGPFTYPIQPDVSVTREKVVSMLAANSTADVRAVLTSFGEFTAVRAHDPNHRSTIAPEVSVPAPVWVAWASNGEKDSERAIVVDAQSAATIATVPQIDALALDSLTDRDTRSCAPPFGVLTRSEATYIRQPLHGETVTMKLVTLGALIRRTGFASLANCGLQECDPTAPVWITIATASDHRFLRGGPGGPLSVPVGGLGGVSGPVGPTGTTTTIKAGSWTAIGIDARTGPQDTNLGGSYSSAGTPPAGLLALPDLAPR